MTSSQQVHNMFFWCNVALMLYDWSWMYCVLCRSANLLNIERVLLIAERYINNVEELHTAARSILPHGASFQGLPLTFSVVCDAHKKEFPIQVLPHIFFSINLKIVIFFSYMSCAFSDICTYLWPEKCMLSLQAHNNETVGSLRNKIAKVLKVPAEQIQFLSNEKMVNSPNVCVFFLIICIYIVAINICLLQY